MKGGEKLPTHTFHPHRRTGRLVENMESKKNIRQRGEKEEQEQQ